MNRTSTLARQREKFDATEWWLTNGHAIGNMTADDKILPQDLDALAAAAVAAALRERAEGATKLVSRSRKDCDGVMDQCPVSSCRALGLCLINAPQDAVDSALKRSSTPSASVGTQASK